MNIKRNRSAVLVSNVFFLTVFTFFLTSLMTTLGSVIDGFIIGNTMGTKEIGACSLASPMWFIMSIFYNVLAMGCQPFCAQELGRGRPDKARELERHRTWFYQRQPAPLDGTAFDLQKR